MTNFVRRFAIVLSATAMTVGLLGTAAQADDDKGDSLKKSSNTSLRDTYWP
jgi:hypothetical protein